VKAAAAHGTSGGAGPLPHLDQIQRLFGRHDVSGVRAYVGGSAAEGTAALGAQAFATGDQVAFGAAPDLHTAAHEAAHVVQQRGGVHLKGGIDEPGDAYERHADEVADLVVRGESAEAVLDRHAGAGGAPGVQRQVKTHYGEFKTPRYDAVGDHGVNIELEFHPGPNVDATKIGLTQQVRSQLGGKAVGITPNHSGRMVKQGVGEGSQIDRVVTATNPIYGGGTPDSGDLARTPTSSSNMKTGYRYMDRDTEKTKPAWLFDGPELQGRANNSSQVFESAALALEGRQQGTFMGSVQWGWKVDGGGKFEKLDLKLMSNDVPTESFMAAARQWNDSKALGTLQTAADPTKVYDTNYAEVFEIAKGTVVKRLPQRAWIQGTVVYNAVSIEDGDHKDETGRIKVADLQDANDGEPHLPLPIQGVGQVGARTAQVRDQGSSSGRVLAELPPGTRVKCMSMTGAWWRVEIDTTQSSVVLKSDQEGLLDNAKMLRGFLPQTAIRMPGSEPELVELSEPNSEPLPNPWAQQQPTPDLTPVEMVRTIGLNDRMLRAVLQLIGSEERMRLRSMLRDGDGEVDHGVPPRIAKLAISVIEDLERASKLPCRVEARWI
jgi:hypothetical protein